MAVQLTLNFEPGLAERHKTLKACVRERIYAHPKQFKTLAADMDLSASELNRKLSENPEDTRDLNCCDLEAYIAATNDHVPIYYLIEKYAVSTEAKQAYAASELAKLLPTIMAMAKTMGVK